MKKVSFSKKAMATVSIFTLLTLGFFIFYVYPNFIFSKPLGDKLEYIGKTDYGCWLVCDANPGSTYYYATDMSVEEVTKYFKKSSMIEKPSTIDGETYFGIKTPSSETIYMYYYKDKHHKKVERVGNLRSSAKQHVLTLPSFKYDAAKNSL